MAKISAKNAQLFGGGRDISGHSNSATMTFSAEAPEVTAFRDDYRQRLSSGLKDAELTVDGFFDASASSVDELFSGLLAGSTYWGFYPATASTAYPGREIGGILTEYETAAAVEEAVTTSITVTCYPPVLYCKSLGYPHLTGQAAGSGALDSVDFGASSAESWTVMRVLALGGTSVSLAASLQHSADNSIWTTLYDFGSFSSANQVVAASLSSASRYRRVKYQLSGTSPLEAKFFVSAGSVLGA